MWGKSLSHRTESFFCIFRMFFLRTVQHLNFKWNFRFLESTCTCMWYLRKNKARETEILRTASASGREEVDKRTGRGEGRSGEGEEAFPVVHPFRCHSMSIFQRYIPFVSKDDKPIYLHVNLFFNSIMHLHPT